MNWFKFFGKRKKQRGFTLTELIVVTAIIVLLMACVVAFASPVRMMIGNTTAKDDALTINKIIGDYIERKLSYANYIDVYVGYDYSNSDTALKKSFKNVQDRVKADHQVNRGGILIFRYTEDKQDPLKSTFKVYDVPIIKSAPATGISSLSSLTTITPSYDSVTHAMTSDPLEEYRVFDDAFYNAYEYFITCDDSTIQTNSSKRRSYLNFRVDSYNFKGEFHPEAFNHVKDGSTDNVIIDYYKYVDNPSHTTADNPFNDLIQERTGSELVSFTLENILVETKPAKSDPALTYFDKIEATHEGVTLTRGKTVGGASDPTYTSDTLIFYNIRTYNVKESVAG